MSKRIPLPLVVEACRAGEWDLGENRIPEALDRQPELPGQRAGASRTWSSEVTEHGLVLVVLVVVLLVLVVVVLVLVLVEILVQEVLAFKEDLRGITRYYTQ